ELNEGDRIDLGRAPDGNSPWFLETLHTPGHAAGHLSFHEPRYQLLFVGDMVSTQSSVVIAPPDGDLTLYLASLHRLRSMACRLLLPAHGSPSARHQFTIDEALAHRAKREEQLLQALKEGPRLPLDLVSELYRGVPTSLMQMAEMQLLAGLRKLQAEGRAEPVGESWRLKNAG